MSQTVSLTVLLAASGLLFSLFGKYALDMRRDKKYRESWGWASWALVPGFLSALYLMTQDAGVSAMARNAVLGGLGAALGACIAIWLGYVLLPLGAAAQAQENPSKADIMSGKPGGKPIDKPSQSTTGKNSPIINAPTTNSNFGDIYKDPRTWGFSQEQCDAFKAALRARSEKTDIFIRLDDPLARNIRDQLIVMISSVPGWRAINQGDNLTNTLNARGLVLSVPDAAHPSPEARELMAAFTASGLQPVPVYQGGFNAVRIVVGAPP